MNVSNHKTILEVAEAGYFLRDVHTSNDVDAPLTVLNFCKDINKEAIVMVRSNAKVITVLEFSSFTASDNYIATLPVSEV